MRVFIFFHPYIPSLAWESESLPGFFDVVIFISLKEFPVYSPENLDRSLVQQTLAEMETVHRLGIHPDLERVFKFVRKNLFLVKRSLLAFLNISKIQTRGNLWD